MSKTPFNVGRVSDSVTRQAVAESETDVGLRSANPTYESDMKDTAEWKSYRLGEIGQIITGKTPLTNDPKNQGSDIPFITPADFVGNKWIKKTIRSISKIGSESVKNCLIPKNAVLVTCIGSDMGKARLSTMQCVTNQQINSIIVNTHKFLPEFIYYNLSLKQQEIKGMAGGSAVPILKKSAFSDMWIECPNLKTQKEIISILSVIDDRIVLLRETNATLEAIAQALFKSWFVDFDPVHAKQQGREPEGMDSDTAALFPDGFEESELGLGLVPMGWRVTNLSEAFEINPTRVLKKGTVAPYLDMAKLSPSGHCVEPPIQRKMASGSKFRNGDSLMARITPCLENGKIAFVDFLADGQIGWGSTEFLVLRPKAPLPEYFGYLLCRHSVFRDFAVQSMSGTSGRQRIQNDLLGRYSLALPDSLIALAFQNVIEPIQKCISANHEQTQTLTTLRDTLLPRLISGQLRLPDAEEAVA